MKTVVFNPRAVADLAEITSYIAQANPMAAEAVRENLLDTTECLAPPAGICTS